MTRFYNVVIIVLRKLGKLLDTRKKVKGQRLISLLNIAGKLIERIIVFYIANIVEEEVNMLLKSQIGNKKGRNIINIIIERAEAAQIKRVFIAFFNINISSVFNKILY